MTVLTMGQSNLDTVLDKATNGYSLSFKDIYYLLSLEKPEDLSKVMTAARRLRAQYFGDKVFLYGFIYFSTFCRNHCTFCFYRQTNDLSPRYRKNISEIVDIAVGLAESGVHLVDLTMGEDPMFHDSGNYEFLFDSIRRVKKATNLPVMISPGVIPDEIISTMAELNVNWYALYQETHNPVLYKKLRTGQSFSERANKRVFAARTGMLVEDGVLLGVGETKSDLAHSIMTMREQGLDQVRVMSLVPQKQTPLANRPPASRIKEYLSIAVMRLVMPDRLIPASLDVDGIKGLQMRLEAGANVITSIIPPSSSLAGVSQSSLDIEQGLRTVPEVRKIISGMGLQVAETAEYVNWMADRKKIQADGGERYDQDRYSGRTVTGIGSRVPCTTSRI